MSDPSSDVADSREEHQFDASDSFHARSQTQRRSPPSKLLTRDELGEGGYPKPNRVTTVTL
jgi:hypothetical protein